MLTCIRKQKWSDLDGYTWSDLSGYTWDQLPGDCYTDISESLILSDLVSKLPSKLLYSPLPLSDSFALLLSWKLGLFDPFVLDDDLYNRISKYIDDSIIQSDVISKSIFVLVNDDVSLVTQLIPSGYLALQDIIPLYDIVKFNIKKGLLESLTLSDLISELLETPAIYISNFNIYPEYIISDLMLYGGAEMHFYPNQAVVIKFNVSGYDDKTLTDPDSFNIEVYDPKDVNRVSYDYMNISKISTGCYKYIFKLPTDVVGGNWYIKLSAIKNSWTTVIDIDFEVKKR